MMAARRKMGPSKRLRGTPAASRLPKDKVIETPTIHRNEGNTVSVIVHPFHDAWLSGVYDFGPPALFTTIIRAMVAPRIASNAVKRELGCPDTLGALTASDSGLLTLAIQSKGLEALVSHRPGLLSQLNSPRFSGEKTLR